MNLKSLSDKTLLSITLVLAKEERELLVKILWHLREIDSRKLYADLKCGSLFEYCVKVLKYSEGQASRRIKASRLLRELPELSPKIEKGLLNLTQLNQVSQFISDEGINDRNDKMRIFEIVQDLTVRETEKILWEMKKEDTPRTVRITIKEETLEKIRKIQNRKAHIHKDIDSVISKMCDDYAEIWDPSIVKRKSSVTESDTRYIPTQVRAEVWDRDQGKCQNCGSTYALQFDHKKAFAKGGKTSVENMQLLCRNCNQRKGFVEFRAGKKSPLGNKI